MFNTYFTSEQFSLLASSLAIYILSIISFYFIKKKVLAVLFLLTATFLLKSFQICLDPFLNLWDEQMHALVAKNMSHNFLKPTLYPKEILPYDFTNWVGNYIWVHKQPMFLWQMALSIKIFGVSPFAIRLPSVVCFTFATFFVYRIGKNVSNISVGYWGAIFFSTNYYFGELISGATPTDQNDIVFISYVTASIWAFTEHVKDPEKRKWWILIGVFAGFAVLTKWLVGLLVYAGWGTYILINISKPIKLIVFSKYIKSILITILVFAPWQFFVFAVYPREAKYEYLFNAKHFNEALEGHVGDNWFHYDKMELLYGYISPLFCLLGVILINKYIKDKKMYSSLLVLLFVTYLFFTMAATKMNGFTLVVSSIVYVGIGAICFTFYNFINAENKTYRKVFFVFLMISVVILNINIESFQINHSNWKKNLFLYYNRKTQIEWRDFCENLETQLPDKKYIIFNCPEPLQNIKLMFYSDYIAYMGMPTSEQIQIIQNKGYKVAIYDNGNLPSEIISNKAFTLVSCPATKMIRVDSIYIMTKSKKYLSLDWEGKLVANDNGAKEMFFVKSFSDGTSKLVSQKGLIATAAFHLGGKVYFSKNEYTVTERFRFVKLQNGNFKIMTEDNTKLSLSGVGAEIIAENGDWRKDDEFIIGK